MFKNKVFFINLLFVACLYQTNFNIFLSNFFSQSIHLTLFFLFINKSVAILFLFFNFLNNFLDIFQQFTVFKSFNTGLLNILGLYHPFLLFFAIFRFLKFFRLNFFFFFIKVHKKKPHFNISNLVITFFLGSYWAGQELLWGGFWNWDLVELTLFVLVFCAILGFHLFFIKTLLLNSFIYFFKIFFYVLCLYFIINRSPLVISQHLFSASFLFKIDRLFYVIVYSIIYLSFVFFFFKQKKNTFFILFVSVLFLFYTLLFVFVMWNYLFFNSLFLNKLFIKSILLFVYIYINLWFYNLVLFLCTQLMWFYLLVLVIKKWPIFKKKIHVYKHLLYFIFIIFYFYYFLSNINFFNHHMFSFFSLKKNTFLYSLIFFNKTSFNLKNVNSECVHQIINFFIFIFSDKFFFYNCIYESYLQNTNIINLYSCSFGFFHVLIFFFFSKLVFFFKTKF